MLTIATRCSRALGGRVRRKRVEGQIFRDLMGDRSEIFGGGGPSLIPSEMRGRPLGMGFFQRN